MKITKCKGEGQGSCKRCSDKGKWNRTWMCFLYKIEGYEGCYCSDCVKEIQAEKGGVALMREILFRGKSTKTSEWVQGDLIHRKIWSSQLQVIRVEDNGFDNFTEYEVIPETVGQYTGLTDKNGTKIFEGDICKHRSNYSGEYIISVVTYTDGQFLAMADNNSGFNLSDNLKVIGNIHDNPELLKGGDKEWKLYTNKVT